MLPQKVPLIFYAMIPPIHSLDLLLPRGPSRNILKTIQS